MSRPTGGFEDELWPEPKPEGLSLSARDVVRDPSHLWEPPPERGDSAAVAGRVTMIVKRMIQEAVQSGLFRFRTENDLVRAAVVTFMREKVAPFMEGNASDVLKRMEMVRRMLMTTRYLIDAESTVNNLRAAFKTATRTGQVDTAQELVRRTWKELESDTSEWADSVRGQILADQQLRVFVQ